MTDLEDVLTEATDWARGVFTTATILSVAAHLRREAVELAARPDDPEEMADIAILGHQLMTLVKEHADLHGVDLARAVYAKHAKNRARRWGKPDAEGVVEHLDDARLERC